MSFILSECFSVKVVSGGEGVFKFDGVTVHAENIVKENKTKKQIHRFMSLSPNKLSLSVLF
jgi:hypothetical protein